jgi:hypothetical protein
LELPETRCRSLTAVAGTIHPKAGEDRKPRPDCVPKLFAPAKNCVRRTEIEVRQNPKTTLLTALEKETPRRGPEKIRLTNIWDLGYGFGNLRKSV